MPDEAMDKAGGDTSNSQDARSDSDSKQRHRDSAPDSATKNPKKRRKVNHACVYCRRSHMTCDLARPCTRCIKRNIGHLCHDEPRDADSKKAKSTHGTPTVDESDAQSDMARTSVDHGTNQMVPPSFNSRLEASSGPGSKASFGPATSSALGGGNPLQLVRPVPVSGIQSSALNSSSDMNQFAGFSDAWLTAQTHFNDMHNFNHNYMVAPEVTNEFSILNDFIHSSLLDDNAALLDDQNQLPRSSQGEMGPGLLGGGGGGGGRSNNRLAAAASAPGGSMPPPNAEQGSSSSSSNMVRPGTSTSAVKGEKDYYLEAADPKGNDTPEERMKHVLEAKVEAGLLKPFNYIKGYARLQAYLDSHIAPASKKKILCQLDNFRPKFREKMHMLTDIQLVFVEMWFEEILMEYDRVFASMAVPACCWRRTGEIFRGNKEMAELIHVPVERLRDGQIALHEILTEESVVRYWEEFGTIAFDPAHDSLLTACSLKNPDDGSKHPKIDCCFALKIQRDNFNIPSLIVGNFLPHDPPH